MGVDHGNLARFLASVRRPGATVQQIAAHFDAPEAEIRATLDAMESDGWVTRREGFYSAEPHVLDQISQPEASAPHQVTDVIILVHGIRDRASWYQKIEREFDAPGEWVTGPRYGYFDVFRFLAPWDFSAKPRRKLVEVMRDARSAHKNARISVIAHSFGTHVVTRVLQDEPDIHIHRLVLCGAVLDQHFRFAKIIDRIGRKEDSRPKIVNDCGSSDAWPALAQAAGWRYGSAGTDGAGDAFVANRFHTGGHGLFFKRKFIKDYWVPFIREGRVARGTGGQGVGVKGWVRKISHLPLNWLLLLIFLFALYITYARVAPLFVTPVWPLKPGKSLPVRAEEDDSIIDYGFVHPQDSLRDDTILDRVDTLFRRSADGRSRSEIRRENGRYIGTLVTVSRKHGSENGTIRDVQAFREAADVAILALRGSCDPKPIRSHLYRPEDITASIGDRRSNDTYHFETDAVELPLRDFTLRDKKVDVEARFKDRLEQAIGAPLPEHLREKGIADLWFQECLGANEQWNLARDAISVRIQHFADLTWDPKTHALRGPFREEMEFSYAAGPKKFILYYGTVEIGLGPRPE